MQNKINSAMPNFDAIQNPNSGGLAFVTIPSSNGMMTPLLDQDDIEDTLLEYSKTHFAQAEGLLFIQEPLSHLLQYN